MRSFHTCFISRDSGCSLNVEKNSELTSSVTRPSLISLISFASCFQQWWICTLSAHAHAYIYCTLNSLTTLNCEWVGSKYTRVHDSFVIVNTRSDHEVSWNLALLLLLASINFILKYSVNQLWLYSMGGVKVKDKRTTNSDIWEYI